MKQCLVCGEAFHAPLNNPHKMYCCNACKVRACKQAKDPMFGNRREARRIAKKAKEAASAHERSMAQARRLASRRATWVRACAQCDVSYSAIGGNVMKFCGADCIMASKRERKKAARLAGKAIKRAATVETVSPILVFRRDGWVCYLCGRSTPESLRGTYQDNAPELEHMLPLSRGGAHSYTNVRCACRACNLIKVDRTLDEIGGPFQLGAGGSKLRGDLPGNRAPTFALINFRNGQETPAPRR